MQDLVQSQRYNSIVQSNTFVRDSMNDLSLMEIKLFYCLVSNIKRGDDEFHYQEFTVSELMKILCIPRCGTSHASVKKSLKRLGSATFWMHDDIIQGDEDLKHLVGSVRINNNRAIIKLHDDLKPYLLDQKGQFIQSFLRETLCLDRKCSVMYYYFLKSYTSNIKIMHSVDELKQLLGLEGKYKTWADFKRNVLEKMKDEINEYTQLDLDFEYTKEGRSYKWITPIFKSKKGKQLIQMERNIETKIGPSGYFNYEITDKSTRKKSADVLKLEAEDQRKKAPKPLTMAEMTALISDPFGDSEKPIEYTVHDMPLSANSSSFLLSEQEEYFYANLQLLMGYERLSSAEFEEVLAEYNQEAIERLKVKFMRSLAEPKTFVKEIPEDVIEAMLKKEIQ